MTASPVPHVGMPSAEAIEAEILPMSYEGADLTECVDRILSLIRPAFEAKDAEIERLKKLPVIADYVEVQDARRAAEAKLAQAVEAMEPFDDALGEDDEGYGGGLTVVMKWGACSVYSVTLEDLRDLRKAVRACEDRLDEASAASAAARGETE